jgi:hypothetical protein
VEKGHDRGVASVFGPVRATRLAYRNRREPNLYPADVRWALPDDLYSLGMRALAAYHLAISGYGQAQEIIAARTGVRIGRAQLAGLAADLAAWTGDFYEQRARGADTGPPDAGVLMMRKYSVIPWESDAGSGAARAIFAMPGICVTPRTCTRRVDISITNTVSTVKKSHASSLSAYLRVIRR